ncbi:hypothetical protein BSQ49_05885 [Liquorilactobacillus hordei]|uniref:Uncharacterized protein n=1 Tax=Liquorilactobacillus hordei TaxID=468911 RepID=A0A3S6QP19_9LACO|nr:hypothetical protein BSQ49_05885 [Liquorilactobacillus hordei]
MKFHFDFQDICLVYNNSQYYYIKYAEYKIEWKDLGQLIKVLFIPVMNSIHINMTKMNFTNHLFWDIINLVAIKLIENLSINKSRGGYP